jgi:hypothetical protein
MKKLWIAFGIACAMSGLLAATMRADDKPVSWYDKLKVSGFLDAYYMLNANVQSGGTSGNIDVPGATVTRAFDVRQNEFSLSGAKIALAESDTVTGIGGEFDLLYGPMGTISVGGPIEQAFVTFGLGPVGIKFGKMVTHLSFEVIDTPANWNYSRSILFTEVPYYHVGFMANYSPLNGVGVMVGAANGNSIDQANDEAKDILAQVTYSAIAGLSLTGNYYLESNRAVVGLQPFENTHYLELVGTYQATPQANLGLDYLYRTTIASKDTYPDGTPAGSSLSPKGQGYALYVDYVTPLAALSVIPRFEQWYAPDAGVFAIDYTLTLKYTAGALIHYLELRSDVATPASFQPSGAPTADPALLKDRQLTLTYGVNFVF